MPKKTSPIVFVTLALLLLLPLNTRAEGDFFTVKNATFQGNSTQNYPVFSAGNPKAAPQINTFFQALVPTFITQKRASYQDDNIYVKSEYEITYNDNNYLSVIFTFEYGLEGWPQTQMFGYVFDSKTGRQLSVKDLQITSQAIKNELKKMFNAKNIKISKDINLTKQIKNFYYDSNFNLHVIFDKGSIAPEAYGIIDITINE